MLIAGVAQLVEQRIRNAQVGGSSPFTSSIDFGLNSVFEPFFFAFFYIPVIPHRSSVKYVRQLFPPMR